MLQLLLVIVYMLNVIKLMDWSTFSKSFFQILIINKQLYLLDFLINFFLTKMLIKFKLIKCKHLNDD
jgi:hypothetical protein